MKKKTLAFFLYSQYVVFIVGLLMCIISFDGWFWISDAISFMGTQEPAKYIFTPVLLLLSFLGCTYSVMAYYVLFKSKKMTVERKIIFGISLAATLVGHLCLAVAAVVPVHIYPDLHRVLAIAYFALFPSSIIISSFLLPKKFSEFAAFSRYLMIVCLLGTYIFFKIMWGVVPAQTYYVLMIGSWIFFLYKVVLEELGAE